MQYNHLLTVKNLSQWLQLHPTWGSGEIYRCPV